MSKKILIQQTLHGYLNGHHLLATSKALSDYSQKVMSILSDLSGPEIYKDFSEYITGYPLPDDSYYAISKTWYASEMRRPGCVWTHTLLINMEDLCDIKSYRNLIKLFVRPSLNYDKILYSNPIELTIDLTNVEDNNNLISAEKLKQLIWLVYNYENPVIVPSISSEEYMNETLYLWENQNPEIRKKFTFCTGSLAGRKLNKDNFDLQIVPGSVARSISRTIGTARVLDDLNMQVHDCEWVETLFKDMYCRLDSNFNEFFKTFSKGFSKRKDISRFAQLFVDSDSKNGKAGITQFFMISDKIWDEYDSIRMKNICIKELFCNVPSKWFRYQNIFGFLQDLSTIDNLKGIEFNEEELKNKLCMMLINKRFEAKETFKDLISKDINDFGELLIKTFAKIIQPSMLPELTDMDLGSCHLLITLNPELALCTEIWRQSRDFQSEILNCINTGYLSDSLIISILENIFINSNQFISNQIYKKFGKKAIRIFLDWCLKINNNYNKTKKWMDMCKDEPQECIDWIIKSECSNNIDLVISILSTLNPYDKNVLEVSTIMWIALYKKIKVENLNEYSRSVLSEMLLPVILLKNDIFPNDMVEISFLTIHKQLEKQELSYEKWQRLEMLLPEVAWYNSWDKCKRLRKAMKKRGYVLNGLEN